MSRFEPINFRGFSDKELILTYNFLNEYYFYASIPRLIQDIDNELSVRLSPSRYKYVKMGVWYQ